MIEVILNGKPLAKIDYFNTPPIFPTVWNITHPSQINDTVNSILNPTPEQCYWQEILKSQVIANIGSAAKRTGELIIKMIEFKKSNPNHEFPPNILGSKFFYPKVENDLYAKRETIANNDIKWLKAKLIRLEWENKKLKEENSRKNLTNLLISLYNKIKK
ncbi:MAG: hypothetical protein QXT71_05760 [Thermoplasmata archaeon]